jgi:hypothetical protein
MLDGALPPARHDARTSRSSSSYATTPAGWVFARGPVAFVAATTILIRMGRARHLRVTLVPMAWLVARGGGRP